MCNAYKQDERGANEEQSEGPLPMFSRISTGAYLSIAPLSPLG